MTDYLVVPQARRERLLHEKARARRGAEIRWVRVYLDDVDQGDPLWSEPLYVRFLDDRLAAIAARSNWMLKADHVALSRRLGMRSRDVRDGLIRLLQLGRFELLTNVSDTGTGVVQPSLFPSSSSTVAPPQGHGSSTVAQSQRHDEPRSHAGFHKPAASDRLAQIREEKNLEAKQSGRRMNGSALPSDRETVNRLAAIAARDDPQSQTIIHRYATGLPDAAIARTIESYLGRRPRPRNPAGYVVSTLKSLRTEYGLETATIDQEPDL